MKLHGPAHAEPVDDVSVHNSNYRRSIHLNPGSAYGINLLGVSLLEILIVIAILAVLCTYLIPSYHNYMRRGYRATVIASVYQAAQFVEQFIAEQASNGGKRDLLLPAGLDRSPPDGKIVYQLTVDGPNAENENGGYTIIAKPADTGPMRDDECGSYRLDAIGRRSNQINRINSDQTDQKVALCWQRP